MENSGQLSYRFGRVVSASKGPSQVGIMSLRTWVPRRPGTEDRSLMAPLQGRDLATQEGEPPRL